jgi:hypothetical protein
MLQVCASLFNHSPLTTHHSSPRTAGCVLQVCPSSAAQTAPLRSSYYYNLA